MKKDIHLLYEDLNKLLNDICTFLSDELKDDQISNKHLANELIQRSKTQLVEIAAAVPSFPDADSGSYVDMNKKLDYANSDIASNHQDIYSDVDAAAETSASHQDLQMLCPFASKPAQDLEARKCGYLERKGKFLFIEHQKKVYAAICQSWMLIYCSEKDQKPNEILNLYNYVTKTVESPKESKRKDCFELVSFENGKVHQFTATTTKDMEQWVAAIEKGRKCQGLCMKSLSGPRISVEIPGENVYEKLLDDEISVLRKPLHTKNTSMPSLPPRHVNIHYIMNRPIPSLPPNVEADNVHAPPPPDELQLSESSDPIFYDDGDNFYDVLVSNTPPQPNSQQVSVSASSANSVVDESSFSDDDPYAIYDVVQTLPIINEKKQTSEPKPTSQLEAAVGREEAVEEKPLEEEESNYGELMLTSKDMQTPVKHDERPSSKGEHLEEDGGNYHVLAMPTCALQSFRRNNVPVSAKAKPQYPIVKQAGDRQIKDDVDNYDILVMPAHASGLLKLNVKGDRLVHNQPSERAPRPHQISKAEIVQLAEGGNEYDPVQANFCSKLEERIAAFNQKSKPAIPTVKPTLKPKVIHTIGRENENHAKVNSFIRHLSKKTKT